MNGLPRLSRQSAQLHRLAKMLGKRARLQPWLQGQSELPDQKTSRRAEILPGPVIPSYARNDKRRGPPDEIVEDTTA